MTVRLEKVLLFSLIYCSLVFVHQRHFNTPTPVSRLDCLHAIVSDGTLAIDRWRTNTPDVAFANGHYYSDKAPGTIALALPGFLVGASLLGVFGTEFESNESWLITSWTACAGIALIVAYGLLKLSELLARVTNPIAGSITGAAVWFGAAPLPYSTLLFSHAHVVACIAIGLFALSRARPDAFGFSGNQATPAKEAAWLMLAGFAFGWALNSEYTSGLVVVGCCIAIVGGKLRDYCFIGAGMILPLSLIPLYSWLTIGFPLTLPYSYQASFPQMQEGLYAIKLPNLAVGFNLTFGSSRGLFFWSPFLLCALVGYPGLLNKSRRLFWLTYIIPILQIVIMSGRVWDWTAGPTLGPRYLAPIIPLLALPCAYGAQKVPKLSTVLAFYSILITTVATLTNACPYNSQHPNPLIDLHIPMIITGEFSHNLGMLLGLRPYASVFLYYAILISGIWCLWRSVSAKEFVR